MKGAIFVFTEAGALMAEDIKKLLDFDIYASATVENEAYEKIPIRLTDYIGDLIIKGYNAFVFISACGIAVRSMAPHIIDKTVDPAVVVVDWQGKNVISLLSGHLGGANELSRSIATIIKGQAIITTASDQLGVLAVDMLAMELDCEIDSMVKAKEITAMLVNNKRIAVFSDIPLPKDLSNRGLTTIETLEKADQFQGLILISEKSDIHLKIPTVRLTPKFYSLGIGCRRDVPYIDIAACVKEFLEEYKIDSRKIKKIATIPQKSKEQGIIVLAKELGVSLEIIDLEEVSTVEDMFLGSDFVKETVGVKSVAQPCAFISSGRGKVISERFARKGITLAAAIINNKGDASNG